LLSNDFNYPVFCCCHVSTLSLAHAARLEKRLDPASSAGTIKRSPAYSCRRRNAAYCSLRMDSSIALVRPRSWAFWLISLIMASNGRLERPTSVSFRLSRTSSFRCCSAGAVSYASAASGLTRIVMVLVSILLTSPFSLGNPVEGELPEFTASSGRSVKRTAWKPSSAKMQVVVPEMPSLLSPPAYCFVTPGNSTAVRRGLQYPSSAEDTEGDTLKKLN